MRKLIVLPLLLAGIVGTGCSRRAGPAAPAPQSMNETIAQFLAAVKANNLKRMGELWGTERGSASQSMDAQELNQRVTVIQKYLDHTGYRIIEGPLAVAGHDDRRNYRVELQRPNCNQVQPIDVVRTRAGGWLVFDVHLEAATPTERCQPGTGTRP